MNDIIEKLNLLKTVQPTEDLVVKMRTEVLSKAPVSVVSDSNTYNNSIFNINLRSLLASKLAMSFAAFIFVISGGFVTVIASGNSLPGDALYSVKMANESVQLAVTSKDKKAEIGMEQVDRRVEEFAKISQNYSDPKQEEKMEMLLGKIETGTNKVEQGLMEIKDNSVKAKVAKIINIRTEKNTEVLVKTNENLPDIVKDEFSENFASAVDSNKKVNLNSLAVMVELMTNDDKDEITAIVKEKVEEEVVLSGELNIVKIEKVDIDCWECEKAEKDCLEEVDEEGNIRCYFEMIFETTENTIETEQSPDPATENTVETEQPSDSTTLTIEEEKEILIDLLGDLNNGSDNIIDETTTDNDNFDDGEIKGDVDEAVDPKEEENNEEEAVPAEEEPTPVEGILPAENI